MPGIVTFVSQSLALRVSIASQDENLHICLFKHRITYIVVLINI